MSTGVGAENISSVRMKTGSYTGDDGIAHAVTGVGFRPKQLLIIKHETVDNTATNRWYAMDEFVAGGCIWMEGNLFFIAGPARNGIVSLDADGFTVSDGGGNLDPNANLVSYDYVAIG